MYLFFFKILLLITKIEWFCVATGNSLDTGTTLLAKNFLTQRKIVLFCYGIKFLKEIQNG